MAKKDGARNRSKSERVELEETLSASDVAAHLESLAKGLREGAVVLGKRGDFRAPVTGDVDLEIEGRHGKRKSRIELTLAFRRENSDEATPGDEGEPVPTIPDEMSF